jgi:hypothetical protein
MVWPTFDASIAVNQALGALYTLAGTFIGGYLAFRLGWRQLRNARAIDRRLEWSEKLVETAKEYRTSVGLAIMLCEDEDAESRVDFIGQVLEAAHTSGQALQALLSRADIYGTLQEQFATQRLTLSLMRAGIITGAHSLKELPSAEDRALLRSTMVALDEHRPVLVARARAEMGLTE